MSATWARESRKTKRGMNGFTIVELLIVIVVIGILAAIVATSFAGSQGKARDSRRLADMKTIEKALAIYRLDKNDFPTPSYNGPGGWESSSINPEQFLQPLVDAGYLSDVPVDPQNSNTSREYRYYVYPAGNAGCDANRGKFYVLGVMDMESSDGVHPDSPGWACPSRDWESEFNWVTGAFLE